MQLGIFLEVPRTGAGSCGFLLDAGVTAATQTLAGRRQFVLDDTQWQAFQDALDRPVQSKPRLKKLLREPGVLG